jgi:hypothetical protein
MRGPFHEIESSIQQFNCVFGSCGDHSYYPLAEFASRLPNGSCSLSEEDSRIRVSRGAIVGWSVIRKQSRAAQ